MPYIGEDLREEARKTPRSLGELNYAITMLLQDYVLRLGPSYAVVSGALSSAHEAEVEFRRRVLVPLERRKTKENGDVFDPALLDAVHAGFDPSRWTT